MTHQRVFRMACAGRGGSGGRWQKEEDLSVRKKKSQIECGALAAPIAVSRRRDKRADGKVNCQEAVTRDGSFLWKGFQMLVIE